MDKVVAGLVFDLNGQKHGDAFQPNIDSFCLNTFTRVDDMNVTPVRLDTTGGKKNYVSMGSFDFECISDPDRCDPFGITISMYIFTNNDTTGIVIYFATVEAGNGRGIVVKYYASLGRLCIELSTSTKKFNSFSPVGSVAKNSWHHVAFSYKKDNLKAFFNGLYLGSTTTILSTPSTQDKFTTLYLGYHADRTGSAVGYVSNLAIWNNEDAFDNIRRVTACSTTKTGKKQFNNKC